MTEVRLRIQSLRLHLRGFDELAAGSLVDGLGQAISAAIDPGELRRLNGRSLGRVDVGTVTAAAGATPQVVRAEVASAVAGGLNVASPKQQGGPS